MDDMVAQIVKALVRVNYLTNYIDTQYSKTDFYRTDIPSVFSAATKALMGLLEALPKEDEFKELHQDALDSLRKVDEIHKRWKKLRRDMEWDEMAAAFNGDPIVKQEGNVYYGNFGKR